MHQVRRRVIPPGGVALFNIDFGCDRVTDFQGSLFDFDLVNDQALSG